MSLPTSPTTAVVVGAAVAVGVLVASAPSAWAPAPPATSAMAAVSDAPVGAGDRPDARRGGAPTAVEGRCTPAPLTVRAGAVIMVGIPEVTRADDPLAVEVLDAGVGGVFLPATSIEDEEQVRELVAGLRRGSDRRLLVSTDEESGRVAVTRELVGSGPSPRTLAETRSPDEVRDLAAHIGGILSDVGIDLDLAPVVDLHDGPADGVIGDRSFSADPERASTYSMAFAAGLDDEGVAPTVKHFPGHGRTASDTHSRSAHVPTPLEELRRTDLVPFQTAIDAGVPVVMLSHVIYDDIDPTRPATVSPAVYDLLREMGFQGVAMTDSLGMGPIQRRYEYGEAAVRAITAGADMVLATDGRQAAPMRDALVAAVRSGELPEERLDEAAARVTALAGGDTATMSCLDVPLPDLEWDTGPRAARVG